MLRLAVSSAALAARSVGAVRCATGNARRVSVVLLDDNISRKGNAGDVIEVRPGYARNKLIPQKLAKYATPENVARYGTTAADVNAQATEDASSEAEEIVEESNDEQPEEESA